MNTIVFCLAVAMILFFLEIFVPGGILAIIAMGFVGWATVMGFAEYGAYVGAVIFIGSVLFACLLFYLEIKLLAGTSFGKQFLQTTGVSTGQTGLEDGDSLVGKEGRALTRMNPGGQVEVDGKSYTARSLDGFLAKDTKIVVETHEGFILRVKSKPTSG